MGRYPGKKFNLEEKFLPMNLEISFFYVTTPDEDSANQIARTLLEQGLIGCANIIPTMKSLYHWEGQIESSTECILILKTRSDFSLKLQESIQNLHPYKVPCVAEIKLETLNSHYHHWLLNFLADEK